MQRMEYVPATRIRKHPTPDTTVSPVPARLPRVQVIDKKGCVIGYIVLPYGPKYRQRFALRVEPRMRPILV